MVPASTQRQIMAIISTGNGEWPVLPDESTAQESRAALEARRAPKPANSLSRIKQLELNMAIRIHFGLHKAPGTD